MEEVINKNRESWNGFADKYSGEFHNANYINKIIEDPTNAFDKRVIELIKNNFKSLKGLKICVPSSGDNIAVFAFAMMGASVTSCDIANKQLENAKKVSDKYDWGKNITYICDNTMTLEKIKDNEFDLVYTSNGVHVWISDLYSMYNNINRIMKINSLYIMYEIHPFTRPFNDNLEVEKTYDMTGPFKENNEVTFHWRLMDIINPIIVSGLKLIHFEELQNEKDYEWPWWISLTDYVNGVRATKEEVDFKYDWKISPIIAIPNTMIITAKKE